MERKKDGKSFLGVNVKTKLCHQGSWCSFLLWDDFNLVLEEYVSGVMAFREYVTCGYQVIFLHTESAVLGGIKRLREKKKCGCWVSAPFTKCIYVYMSVCLNVCTYILM